MSNHQNTYTRDEILALFIEAHAMASAEDARLSAHEGPAS